MKATIETVNKDGVAIKLDVKNPSGQQISEAQMIYPAEWQKAANKGCILRDKLQDILVEQGVWNDKKAKQEEGIIEEMQKLRQKIENGGYSFKQAQENSMRLIELRNELRTLLYRKNKLEENTAEAHADNASFNYLVSVCTLDAKNGKSYFKDFDDYLERRGEQASIDSATKLFSLINDVQDDSWKELPEIKFLRKYKIMDEKGYLLNKEGERVDQDGRRIDEEGRYIDGKGGFQDKYGNPVDEKGNAIVHFSPFLDDDGNPIEEPK